MNYSYKRLTNDELISLINSAVGVRSFGLNRAQHLNQLHNELVARNIDFSEIGNMTFLSFMKPVRLKDNTIETLD